LQIKLIDQIFDKIVEEEIPRGRSVEEALQKALDNTTVERPGLPWEEIRDKDAETT